MVSPHCVFLDVGSNENSVNFPSDLYNKKMTSVHYVFGDVMSNDVLQRMPCHIDHIGMTSFLLCVMRCRFKRKFEANPLSH